MREPVSAHDRSNPQSGWLGSRSVVLILAWWSLFAAPVVAVAAVRPPANLQVTDQPNDAGKALKVEWTLSPDDREMASPRLVTGYRVERATVGREETDLEFAAVSEEIPYGRRFPSSRS